MWRTPNALVRNVPEATMTLLFLMLDRGSGLLVKRKATITNAPGAETAEWVDVERFGPEVVQMLGGAEQRSPRIRRCVDE
jgi:hypothetical protein